MSPKAENKFNVRFGGAGTHGLIQVARILAEAAAIYDDKIALESCSYGPEARGNASRAEVIISDEAIDYPRAEKVDCLIVLTQEAYDKYATDLKPDGVLIADAGIMTSDKYTVARVFMVPFLEIAQKQCRQMPLINMIALGFFSKVCGKIKTESIQHAMLARIPKESEKLYLHAFNCGQNAEAIQTNA
jgi:2-oxoglutarate ferredoxin oxidoreductase subunit gamma